MHLSRDHHRLRHDRNQPRELPEQHRHAAGQARIDRRPGAAASGDQDRGPRPGPPCPVASAASCAPGLLVMHGYWGTRPPKPARPLTPGLDAHRRPGHHGRRGLREHRRPHQGHGDPWRREHLPARDRRISVPPPQVQDVQVVGVPDSRTAKNSAPGSSQARHPADRRTTSAPSARARLRTTRCRATSALSPASR